jgi:hypothetical protein
MVGGSLSNTRTGKVQVATLLALSVAVHVTVVVVSTVKAEPDAGKHTRVLMPEASRAVTFALKLMVGLLLLSDT